MHVLERRTRGVPVKAATGPGDPFLPLRGLRVLGLTGGAAGTACSRLLTQLGAVVETLGRETRRIDSRIQHGNYDLAISDLPAPDLRALGLDALPPPGRVVVSISPFGCDMEQASVSLSEQAEGGFDPCVAAALCGAHAAAAGLAALRWAEYHQRGVVVEVTTQEVVASCTGGLISRARCPRTGGGDEAADKADSRLVVVPCADGYAGIAASSAEDRDYLSALSECALPMGEPTAWREALATWTGRLSRWEVFHAAQLWRLPVVPVLDHDDVLADEQNTARGVWLRDERGRPRARSPFRFSPPGGINSRQPRAAPLPLSDLRVLDLGMVWAGPYCGRLLAGLGAQVIKVEGPRRRDGTRPANQSRCWGAFADLNQGKASLVLDLANAEGRDLFLSLAARSDVVIENFSPRVMPNFGLDYEALAAASPGLLMLSMPAFGSEGPWASYVAYGSGLELATGLAARRADGLPVPAPIAYLDYLAGSYGAVGLLAAMLARDRHGTGVHLEVAQRDVACQLLESLWGEGRTARESRPSTAGLANDPQLMAQGLYASTQVGGRACRHFARPPWKLHGIPMRRERTAPRFGEDSRRILGKIAGVGDDQFAGLIERGVVQGPSAPRARSGV